VKLFTIHPGASSSTHDVYSGVVRALELDAKFRELNIGLVDGMVAAVAERRRILRVLTTDRRDFRVLRIGERFDKALVLVP